MTRPLVVLVAAIARDGALGRDNGLLCHISEDLKHFKRTTLGAPIVMGRKTWDSLTRKPLPGRRNLVVTRNAHWHADGAERAASLDDALSRLEGVDQAFVIGGAEIYAQALPLADELVITEIDAGFDADVFFPDWDRGAFVAEAGDWQLSEDGHRFRWVTYRRRRAEAVHG